MSIVSNSIGELAEAQVNGKHTGISSNIDLNDNTFSDLLQDKINNLSDSNMAVNQIGNVEEPVGFDITDLFSAPTSIDTNNSSTFKFNDYNNAQDYSASEILTFFPSLFNSKPTLTQTATNGIFDFERKVATASYGQYAKSIVTDLNEFVSDTLKSKS